MDKWNQGNKTTLKEIVLSSLSKIRDLNLRLMDDNSEFDYVKAYKRSILFLSDVLIPFYDKDMTKAYSNFEEEYEKIKKETTKDDFVLKENSYIIRCSEVCRELFRELNHLLKRNDYLKESVFGETSGDDDEVTVEEEEE